VSESRLSIPENDSALPGAVGRLKTPPRGGGRFRWKEGRRVSGGRSGGGDEHPEDLAEQVEQAPVGAVGEAPQEDALVAGLVKGGPEDANPGDAVAPEGAVGVHRRPVTQPSDPREDQEGEQGGGETPGPRGGGLEEGVEPAEGGLSGGRDGRGVFVGGFVRPGELGLATVTGGRAAAGHTYLRVRCVCGGVLPWGSCLWGLGRAARQSRNWQATLAAVKTADSSHRGGGRGFPNAVKTADFHRGLYRGNMADPPDAGK